MSAPDSATQNQSSGILARSAPSRKPVTTVACIGKGPVCVAKRNKRYNDGKPRRPRRLTERRFDPLKLRTLAQWRTAFESLGVITTATICCARKVYWDYPDTAPITQCFKESYLNMAYLPNDEEVVVLLLRLGYTHLQACRALAMTGKRSKDQITDREVNRERRMGYAAKSGGGLCNGGDGEDGGMYVIRWGAKFDPPPPDPPRPDSYYDDATEEPPQKPMRPIEAEKSSSRTTSSDTPPIPGLGLTVKTFLASCMAAPA